MLSNLISQYKGYRVLIAINCLLLIFNFAVWYEILIESSRDGLTVYYLDVGQADATLIEASNGNRMLIDAGAGRSVLEPLFDHLPFYDRRIEVVVATHPHADHIGGVVDVLEHFEVEVFIDSGAEYESQVSKEMAEYLEQSSVEKFYARRGMIIDLGAGTFAPILFPVVNTEAMDTDMASIWTQVIYGETGFLFTGDAPSDIESFMIHQDALNLESDVLQAGHHGSKTSNSLEFLRVVQPEYVVVSAGRDNSHGHPHPEPLENFEAVGAEVFKTLETGDVVFISDGKKVFHQE